MQSISAIIASPGLAIGKAVLYQKKEVFQHSKELEQDVDSEIDRLEQGLKKAASRITKSKNALQEDLQSAELAIFDAHHEILNDPELVEQSKKFISEHKKSLEVALHSVSQQFIDQLLALDDDYFKARAVDIKEVVALVIDCCNEKIGDVILLKEPSILISDDLSPHVFSSMDKAMLNGVITQGGGLTDHMSIICKSMGIPLLVGAAHILSLVDNGSTVVLDGEEGSVILDAEDKVLSDFRTKIISKVSIKKNAKSNAHLRALTKSGASVKVYANVGSLQDAKGCLENGAEGIGLLRTELCFMGSENFPTEEDHFLYYRGILEELQGREVVIRLLDFGSDKTVSYINHEREENPALGSRALRLGFEYKAELLVPQVKAILRLTAEHDISILCPMIATLGDVREVKMLIESIGQTLTSEKIPWNKNTPIGIMVEVPNTAFFIQNFIDSVDFLSFGTNDLAQFLMAADRTNPKVSGYLAEANEGMMKLIAAAVKFAHEKDKWVGICGEIASDLEYVQRFIEMGVDELSMPAQLIPMVKDHIRKLD